MKLTCTAPAITIANWLAGHSINTVHILQYYYTLTFNIFEEGGARASRADVIVSLFLGHASLVRAIFHSFAISYAAPSLLFQRVSIGPIHLIDFLQQLTRDQY